MKRLVALLLILLQFSLFSNAQVTFTNVPKDNQLIGRDLTTNTGSVLIEGTVDQSGSNYDKILVEVFRGNTPYTSQMSPLTYQNGISSFEFAIDIQAELTNYRFAISGISNNIATPLKQVNNVVAGDAFIIVGQSNAEARSYGETTTNIQSDFIRVFGSGMPNEIQAAADTTWYIGQGDGSRFSSGNTGQWGLQLARSLTDELGIPVAIFNGAHGGKDIDFFLPTSDYKTSLNSNYGRLYYRITQAGLNKNIRAVLWSQGEKNALPAYLLSTEQYINKFTDLKDAWKTDYPSIEQYYIFQTRNGCGRILENLMQIKEAQRRLGELNANVHTISTATLEQFDDNCHFEFNDGYEIFGKRAFDLIARDIYDVPSDVDIETPTMKEIFMVNETTAYIVTNAENLLISGYPDDFTLTNAQNASVVDIEVKYNLIKLTFSSDPGEQALLSYECPEEGEAESFVLNSNGINLLSFHQQPIYASVPQNLLEVTDLQENTSEIYPNPTAGIIHFSTDGIPLNGNKVMVWSLSGTMLSQDQLDTYGQLDLTHLKSGTYLLQLEGSSTIHRVVKR